MKQKTINHKIEIIGIGLHSGLEVKMSLEPLNEDSGIIFYRDDKDIEIPLKPEFVIDTKMATVIGKENIIISTIEHLLSAIYSYEIDNLKIVIDSDEVPVLDGSSFPFCDILENIGIKIQQRNKKVIRILKEVEVKIDNKFVKLSPSKETIYDFIIDFKHKFIGKQHFIFNFSKHNYKEIIAPARTFGFLSEVEYLRGIGLVQGGSLQNAIVLNEDDILNPEGLRIQDEFVKHKILDAIGDMSLLGYQMVGKYSAYAGGHHLNHLLTKKLLSDSSNYEIIEIDNSKK